MTSHASGVRFDEHTMWGELIDRRTLGVPPAWFSHLLKAMPAQRNKVKISRVGLHGDEIDEDISIKGLLAGRVDITHRPRNVQSTATSPTGSATRVIQ